MEEIRKAREENKIVRCPETHFPLKPEILLQEGRHSPDAQWWEQAFSSLPHPTPLIVSLMENGGPITEESLLPFVSAFEKLLSRLGGSMRQVTSVSLINNPHSRESMRRALQLLKGKLADSRSLFQREDWKTGGPEAAAREEALAHLGAHVSSFGEKGWNDGTGPPLAPLVQKLPLRLANLVARYGVGVLPVEEHGLFGRGFYFTDSVDHLNECAAACADEVFLVSLVLPGSPFPLSDLNGSPSRERPLTPGYQSHFAAVLRGNGERAGELVIADPSQALPLFVWTRQKPQAPQGDPALPVAAKNRREWTIVQDSSWKGRWFALLSCFEPC